MKSMITAFARSIDTKWSKWSSRGPATQIQCIEIIARGGRRWRPKEEYRYRGFQTALGRANFYPAVGWLARIVGCGAIEREASPS